MESVVLAGSANSELVLFTVIAGCRLARGKFIPPKCLLGCRGAGSGPAGWVGRDYSGYLRGANLSHDGLYWPAPVPGAGWAGQREAGAACSMLGRPTLTREQAMHLH